MMICQHNHLWGEGHPFGTRLERGSREEGDNQSILGVEDLQIVLKDGYVSINLSALEIPYFKRSLQPATRITICLTLRCP